MMLALLWMKARSRLRARSFPCAPGRSNVRLMYAKGIGVEKDLQQALYWWQLAAEKGHPTAASYVRQLKKKMNLQG
jgi:TPR repeat protein